MEKYIYTFYTLTTQEIVEKWQNNKEVPLLFYF